MLIDVMQSVITLCVFNAEYHYTDCDYFECGCAEFHYAECRCAECRYAKYQCEECCGIVHT